MPRTKANPKRRVQGDGGVLQAIDNHQGQLVLPGDAACGPSSTSATPAAKRRQTVFLHDSYDQHASRPSPGVLSALPLSQEDSTRLHHAILTSSSQPFHVAHAHELVDYVNLQLTSPLPSPLTHACGSDIEGTGAEEMAVKCQYQSFSDALVMRFSSNMWTQPLCIALAPSYARFFATHVLTKNILAVAIQVSHTHRHLLAHPRGLMICVMC